MQSNPKAANRSALVNESHLNFYDPSAPYRALLISPPPPVTTAMPSDNQFSSNPAFSRDVPVTNIDPRTGQPKQIPRFYYPPGDDTDYRPLTQPKIIEPRRTNPNLPSPPPPSPPVVVQQPVRNEVPYSQPLPFPPNPYAPGQYYPYPAPYLIPVTTNIDHGPTPLEQSKADVIAAHQKDADLSRLEVYHFTPKQNSSVPSGTLHGQSTQPIVQYHVYPYSGSPAASPPPMPPQPQQFPSYSHPWYANPSNAPPYISEPSQPVLYPVETKARGCQTEQPNTKSRAVSPMRFSSIATTYDDEGHPYADQRPMHTDRYNITTGRTNQRVNDSNKSTPVADCRCLDCQRERGKVLNYYPN